LSRNNDYIIQEKYFKMNYEELSQNLLHLFHAAAQSDEELHLIEVSSILEIIQQKLPEIYPNLPEEYSNIITTQGLEYYKMLNKQNRSYEENYHTFLSFFKQHSQEFSGDLRSFCINTTLAVLDSHKGVNPAEQAFIDRLKKDCKET